VAVLERRVHADLVLALRQRHQVTVAQAEAPALLVVGRPVRDQVGLVGQRVKVRPQLGERKAAAKRGAVDHQVKGVIAHVDDAAPVRAGDSKALEVDEVRWLEIDGVKGVQFREANPPKPDDHRRLQWIAYRKFGGQVQYVNIMLATDGKDFARHQDAMYGVLYSTKLVH